MRWVQFLVAAGLIGYVVCQVTLCTCPNGVEEQALCNGDEIDGERCQIGNCTAPFVDSMSTYSIFTPNYCVCPNANHMNSAEDNCIPDCTCTNGTPVTQDGIECPAGGNICASCNDGGYYVNTLGSCVLPTCSDGIQNGGETGVDCGACCGVCAATCSDGIQNGDEIGVDCGGSCALCIAPVYCNTFNCGTQLSLIKDAASIVCVGGTCTGLVCCTLNLDVTIVGPNTIGDCNFVANSVTKGVTVHAAVTSSASDLITYLWTLNTFTGSFPVQIQQTTVPTFNILSNSGITPLRVNKQALLFVDIQQNVSLGADSAQVFAARSLNFNITLLAGKIPNVLINGPTSIYLNSDLSLTSAITLASQCNATSTDIYTYAWVSTPALPCIARGASGGRRLLQSTGCIDMSKKDLFVPKGLSYLYAGYRYVFDITVKQYNSTGYLKATITAQHQVSVQQSNLVAVITGASTRKFSLTSGFDLLIDGTASYDPDPRETVVPVPLRFEWVIIDVALKSIFDQGINTSILTFNQAKLALIAPGTVFNIELSVYDTCPPLDTSARRLLFGSVEKCRLSKATVQVIFEAGVIVFIEAETRRLGMDGVPVLSTTRYNTNEKLTLTSSIASIPVPTTLTYSWTVYAVNLDSNGAQILTNVTIAPANILSSSAPSSLILAPEALVGATSSIGTYIAKVTITDSLNPSSAVIVPYTIVVNQPPRSGSCTLQTSVTSTTVSCINWIDDGAEALQYEFRYRVHATVASSLTLGDKSTASSKTFILPPGQYNIIVYIFDALGGKTVYDIMSAPYPLVIAAPVATATDCSIPIAIQDQLRQAKQLQDADQFLQLVQYIIPLLLDTTFLNYIDDGSCGTGSVVDFKQSLWDLFDQEISSIASRPRLSAATAEQLTQVLINLVSALQTDPYMTVARFNLFEQVIENILGTVSSRPEIAVQLVTVLSDLLSFVDCELTTTVTDLIALLSRVSVQNTVAGEDGTSLSGTAFDAIGAKASTNSTFTQSSGGLSVSMNAEMLQQAGLTNTAVDITIIKYASALKRCRTGASGDIISIELSGGNGQVVAITDDGKVQVNFDLPVDPQAVLTMNSEKQACRLVKIPKCAWWKDTSVTTGQLGSGYWTDSGCVVLNADKFTGNAEIDANIVLNCQCTHLTDFAMLLKEQDGSDNTDPCSVTDFVGLVYRVGGLTYLLVGVFSARQLFRTYQIDQKHLVAKRVILFQHSIIVAIALFRVLASYRYAGDIRITSPFIVGLISAAPYMIMFWCFTLIVAQWSSIYHLGMSHGAGAFKKIRPFFLAANILVMAVVLILFVSITSTSNTREDRLQIAKIGSIIMASVSIISGVLFGLYANLLGKQLQMANKSLNSGDSKMSNGNGKKQTRQEKVGGQMRRNAIIMIASFVGNSTMWMFSAYGVVIPVVAGMTIESDSAYTALQILFDLAALIVVLSMYDVVLSSAIEKYAVKTAVTSSNKNSNNSTTASTTPNESTAASKDNYRTSSSAVDVEMDVQIQEGSDSD